MSTPQRPDQSYDPPVSGLAPSSQSGVFIGRRVVVIGTGSTFNGVFVYSGTPALGNLILAIAGADGTDPYGNRYFRCLTIINDTTNGISMLTGRPIGVEAGNAFFGTFSQNTGLGNEILSMIMDSARIAGHGDRSKVALFSSALDGSSPANGFLYWVDSGGASHSALQWSLGGITAIGAIDAQHPGTVSPPTAETWQDLSGTVAAGWTPASSPSNPRVKLLAQTNFAYVTGAGTRAAFSTGANFINLPAAYTPVADRSISAYDNSGNPMGCIVRAAGVVEVFPIASTTAANVGGMYPLD